MQSVHDDAPSSALRFLGRFTGNTLDTNTSLARLMYDQPQEEEQTRWRDRPRGYTSWIINGATGGTVLARTDRRRRGTLGRSPLAEAARNGFRSPRRRLTNRGIRCRPGLGVRLPPPRVVARVVCRSVVAVLALIIDTCREAQRERRSKLSLSNLEERCVQLLE